MGGLYMMMGRGLDRLEEVGAGNVVAIGGLQTAILKSATLASTPACRPIAPMLFQVTSIQPLPSSCFQLSHLSSNVPAKQLRFWKNDAA